MGDIRVSVVIPLYNAGEYILKCMDSLDRQDCPFDYEVLIVDDCSTDDSAALVENHIPELGRRNFFHLIRSPENGRAGRARNTGVRAAQGDYILYVDQDDYVDPGILRILWDHSREGDVDLISCGIQESNGTKYYRPELDGDLPLSDEKRIEIMNIYGYVFASLIKRSLLTENSILFPEKVMFEDCLYNEGVISCANRIHTIKDTLYYRETPATSQTASLSPKKLSDRIDAVKIYLEQFGKNPSIQKYIKEINLQAFYYVYLSCMLWMLLTPSLYTKDLFEKSLKEGKAIDISWDEVFRKEKRFTPKLLQMARLVYYAPALAGPVRVIMKKIG